MTALAYKKHRTLGWFYITGFIFLFIQVALGGITRLTGSGLSITSWDVITGIVPPMNDEAWRHEFLEYQHTPQYTIINTHFTLNDFKFIYFWEWIHRFWARTTGLVAVLFLGYLYKQKYLNRATARNIVLLLVLGGLQGVIGWIMVKSGLSGDAIYVKPSKLALHFIMAVILLMMIWIFACSHWLAIRKNPVTKFSRGLQSFAAAILLLTALQFVFGCFMAGTRSAAVVNSFPDINGGWIPSSIWTGEGIYGGVFIHIVHRNLAYLLMILICIWTYFAVRKDTFFTKKIYAFIPFSILLLQLTLGAMSVILSPYIRPNSWGNFEWMAQLHQLVAILFIVVMLSFIYFNHKQSTNSSL